MGHPRPGVHRLSDAAFVALAGGRPDAETLAELRRAQLSRHLLLLRGIVRAAPTIAGPPYERLAAAERAAPGPVRELLRQPLVGVWAAGCLAALHAGTPPDEAGTGHLGELARAAEGHGRADGAAQARPLHAAHDGMRLDVLLDDVHPLRARLGLTPAGRLTDTEVAQWRDCLQAAWRLLVSRHRDHARMISAVLVSVIPVEPDGPARGISASSADAFGAVAMSVPADPVALAAGLLHETLHSVLNAVQYLFDLQGAGAGAAVCYSPWRDDPRPAAGLLHGAYAYLGVTDFWRVQRRDGDPVAAFEFARWRSAVGAVAGDLLGSGVLTTAGTRFVGELRRRTGSWLDEPVPPQVLRLADGANTDHRLRWRLRNLTPDPATVTALAAAWQSGAGPVTRWPGPVVRHGSGRALEVSARLDLTHRVLRGASLTGGGPGDTAYVRGDTAGAGAAYRARLRADPADHEAWAGLALVTGDAALREHVEVVAAVHRALAGAARPAPDPARLASWLRPETAG